MRLTIWLSALALVTTASAKAAEPVIVLRGEGVQIYGCQLVDNGYAWRLKAPDADLKDAAGKSVGHHFAGPSWQARDGSTITGEVMVASPAPQPGAIPWLVLTAKTHTGAGMFAEIAYIVRSATVGGVAPATGCDQAHADAETRIDYSATYTFFPRANYFPRAN